ncbi:MAG: type II secretion system F family protein [Actinomycetota bacterium]
MNASTWIGAVAVIASLFVLWWAFSGKSEGPATPVDLREPGVPRTVDLRSIELQKAAGERAVQPFLEKLGAWVAKVLPSGRMESLNKRIVRAGSPKGWTPQRVMAAKLLLSLGGGGLFLLQFLSKPSAFTLLFAIFVFVFGWLMPDGLLDKRGDARVALIQRDLSDTIDQLTMMVQAGLGLDAAISRISRGSGALAVEFARVIRDMRFGASRGVALNNLAERIDIPELRGFVGALAQAERLGVPVSETLMIQAGELRTKRRQRAEEQAMKLPVKILFPMVFCILPVIFIVILGPAAIKIFEQFNG